MDLRLQRGTWLYHLRPARAGGKDVLEIHATTGEDEAVSRVELDARQAGAGEFVVDGPAGPRRGYAVRDGDSIWVHWAGGTYRLRVARGAGRRAGAAAPAAIASPMPGQVLRLSVAVGDRVERGQVLLVVEAMKMQLEVVAPHPGVVRALPFAPGDRVDAGVPLAEVRAEEAGGAE